MSFCKKISAIDRLKYVIIYRPAAILLCTRSGRKLLPARGCVNKYDSLFLTTNALQKLIREHTHAGTHAHAHTHPHKHTPTCTHTPEKYICLLPVLSDTHTHVCAHNGTIDHERDKKLPKNDPRCRPSPASLSHVG